MQIIDSKFIWAISVATFIAVVLIFILGFHIISVLRLTWRSKEDQERSTDRTGNEARRTTDRRRSKRLEVVRPVFVSGHRSDAEPFFEEAISLQVSAHGGLLVLATSVRVGQELLLATDCTQAPFQSCRVARLGSSAHLRTEVAVEFARPTPEFW
jgi:phosphate/sulfate permease